MDKSKRFKVLVTGTHFTPAQAVIEELKILNPKIQIVYLGRKTTQEGDKTLSAESQVLPNRGVKFIPIITGRLQRSFSFYTIPSLLKIPIGIIQSFFIILKERPSVILSFGGYLGVPVVISGWILSIPIIIHEQTLVSGLANKISSVFADKIAISFRENGDFNPQKVVLTGLPIRSFEESQIELNQDLKKIVTIAQKNKLALILITGGNQGSHIINQTIKNNLEALTKNFCLIHQTGDSKFNDFESLEKLALDLTHPDRYLPLKWIDQQGLGFILKALDLAITRAGINTLIELLSFKVPALIIPIPGHKEQNKNAKFFASLGFARVLPQSEITEDKIVSEIKMALKNLAKRDIQPNDQLIIKDAAKRVAIETILLNERE